VRRLVVYGKQHGCGNCRVDAIVTAPPTGNRTAKITASVDLSAKRRLQLSVLYIDVLIRFTLRLKTAMPNSNWVTVAVSHTFHRDGLNDFMSLLDDLVAVRPHRFVEQKVRNILDPCSGTYKLSVCTSDIEWARLRGIVSIDPETFELVNRADRTDKTMGGAVVEISHRDVASRLFVVVGAEGWWHATYDCPHPHLQQHGGIVTLTRVDAEYLKALLRKGGAPSWCWPKDDTTGRHWPERLRL